MALATSDLTDRAAQLRWRAGNGYHNGSGYLLASDLVLTAAHVVEGTEGLEVKLPLRGEGERDWRTASVCWRARRGPQDAEGLDLALVRVQASYRSVTLARFAHPGAAAGRVPFTGIGLPAFKRRRKCGAAPLRDTAELYGDLVRGEDRKTGAWALHLQRPALPGSDARDDDSPWSGASGAAVICGGCVVGVMRAHPVHEGTLALEAVPVHSVLGDPGFCAALTGDPQPLRWDDPWGVLDRPYQEMSRTDAESLTNLLRPEFGVVRFAGRDDEVRELHDWLAGEDEFAGWLVHGPSGTGKTRLAAHVADRAGRAGWLAGVLPNPAPASLDLVKLAPLLGSGLPLLIVVDEAHWWHTDDLANLLEALGGREDARIRLMMLARGEGQAERGWYAQLHLAAATRIAVDRALARTSVRALAPALADVERRPGVFCDAAAAFAAAVHMPWRPVRAPDLSEPAFDELLVVHLHALRAAISDDDAGDTASPLEAALDWLLRRERVYWNSVSGSRLTGVSERLRMEVVALGAVVGTIDANGEAARRTLEALPDLEGERRRFLTDIDEWLQDLYPGPGRWPPLQPDLVADGLIAGLVKGDEDFVRGLRRLPGQAAAAHLESAVQVLARVGRTHPEEGETAFLELCAGGPSAVLPIAIGTAVRTGDPLGPLIDCYVRDYPDGSLAAQLEPQLPEETITLREAAVAITQQALDNARQREPSRDRDAEVARLANDFSTRLSNVGRREAALEAIDEAVTIRRRLARAQRDAFLPDLAISLNNQSLRLSDLGRRESALEAIDEAVGVCRELAEAHPDAFMPELAGSLGNQSGRLSELGRREAALDAIEEAVSVYRELAKARPDKFLPHLAKSLNNQSVQLGGRGRREAALEAIEEAVTIYRQLAKARRDSFLPDLATSLNNQSVDLSEMGRRESALAAIEEALTIRRKLAKARPDAFLPDLATSLNNQSILLADLGRREAALEAVEEAVGVFRQLAEVRPHAFVPHLATSLNNQSGCLSDLGRRKEALAAIEKAIRLVLPMLERASYVLSDSGLGLAQRYVELCEQVERRPNEEVLQRMYVILVSAGILTPEQDDE
jgi:tetratricopeptide (TPR) repeat protein